jgi:predicted GNAT family acetyltransferase
MSELRFEHIGDAIGREYQGTDYAILDNKIVGKILWTSMPGDATAYIRYVEVDPDHRRHGIATALLEHLLDSSSFEGWEMLGDFATKEGRAWMKHVEKTRAEPKLPYYYFYDISINWPEWDIDALAAIIENSEVITKNDFIKRVYLNENMSNMIPDEGSFYTSTVDGETFYYFVWNHIEHIFRLDPNDRLPRSRQ